MFRIFHNFENITQISNVNIIYEATITVTMPRKYLICANIYEIDISTNTVPCNNNEMYYYLDCTDPNGGDKDYPLEIYWKQSEGRYRYTQLHQNRPYGFDGHIHKYRFKSYSEYKSFVTRVDWMECSAERYAAIVLLSDNVIKRKFSYLQQLDAEPEMWCSELIHFVQDFGIHRVPLTLRFWAENQFLYAFTPIDAPYWPKLSYGIVRPAAAKRSLTELEKIRKEKMDIHKERERIHHIRIYNT